MNKMQVDKKVQELQEWITTQPNFPQKIDYCILKLFILSKNGDLEAAKLQLEFHLKFRLKYENIFLKRDPLDKATRRHLEVESFLQLPGRTPNNYKVFLNKLNDYDPNNYNFDEVIKTFFMMSDLFGIIGDENEDEDIDEYDGEVVIFDMSGMTWRHQMKSSLSSVRIFMKAIQEAYPLRLKQIHIINATSFIDTAVRLVKPFMKSELLNMLQIHLPGSEVPYDYFPRDILPEEYGGKAGKLSDLREYWMTKLLEKREYLMDPSRWKLNES